ncbi:6-phosphogluconolactonase [Spirosoma montaniterrae]|uniref:6-phosphogluconolactonase n=1 Tax=Spirosoma montaniterrae TaxID=1178516 RepID=A0A1P9WUY5_9BACT|nr:6-phosphogluconolactonase [Spirosoma montaniterrae]AQG79169.1 6-phosphogluconolactonase [Spirosoma montaniterrae]
MQLIVTKNSADLAKKAADFIAKRIVDTLKKQERFTIALSGGSTPKALHELLAKSPYAEQIPWLQLHVFWGDERYVSIDDPLSNAGMAYDTLLGHVYTPEDQIHVWRTDLDPEAAAADYSRILHDYFPDAAAPTFDLVLLGMGDDGHTLSLFPGTDVVHEQTAWTKAYFLTQQNMYRLTLTAPVVNRAACVLFLVAGPKKAEPLRHVLEGEFQPDSYPSQMIKPTNGELVWMVDEQAAAGLRV